MDLSGQQIIDADLNVVWMALNNTEILKDCVPGCEELVAISPTEFEGVVKAKVGPITARFKGKLHITRSDPPKGYSLAFEGQGGVAGFAKGSAEVSLEKAGSGTELAYLAKAQIGGKLAQIGSRLVDMAAGKMTQQFFDAFGRRLASERHEDSTENTVLSAGARVEQAHAAVSHTKRRSNRQWIVGAWLAVAAILVGVLFA